MKKIMFNDRYGLTQAVLYGRKTMTRRVISQIHDFDEVGVWPAPYITIIRDGKQLPDIFPTYRVGEVVAVAQSGRDIYHELQKRYGKTSDAALGFMEMYQDLPMWTNKMFVPPTLCPNKIQITGIKVERLQDISGKDYLKEGVKEYDYYDYGFWKQGVGFVHGYRTPREAFARLIDKVSKKGTWNSNPWVFAYTFKLIQ